jgi:hypothetical protein
MCKNLGGFFTDVPAAATILLSTYYSCSNDAMANNKSSFL